LEQRLQEQEAQLTKLKAEREAESKALREQVEAEKKAHEAAIRKMHEATTAKAELERKLKAKPQLTEKDIERLREDPMAMYEALNSQMESSMSERLSELQQAIEERDRQLASYLVEQEKKVSSTFQSLDPRTQSDEYKRIKEVLPHLENEEVFKLMDSGVKPPSAPGGSQRVPSKPPEGDQSDALVKGIFGPVLSRFPAKEAK
jgi:hypothetical protein